MTLKSFRKYCNSLKGTSEDFPFDKQTLVMKVKGKMFALGGINEFKQINLKCNPDEAMHLRDIFPSVIPGYHMNKRHWNTIILDGSIPDEQIYDWIKKSYDLVVSSLTKKVQKELNEF